MPTHRLTDAACKAAKPRDRAYKLFDGLGLALWLSPAGARVWRVFYRLSGRQQQISLGPYPQTTLAQARVLLDGIRATLRAGGDPMAERRPAAPSLTLRQACEAYWAGRQDCAEGYRTDALRALELHIWPACGGRPVRELARADVLAPLLRMDAAGHYVYARRTRMWLAQVLDWCVERGHAESNPAASIKPAAFGRRPVVHFPAVDLAEVPLLVQRLAIERDLTSVLACRLLALTWVRTAELRGMAWAELDGDVWRIPAARMKRARDHLVPLPRQALAILATLRARTVGDLVLHADHRTDRAMSENTILALFARVGYRGRMTGHGWRTVASTWANEAGYNRDAIERQLAHAPDDKVRAAYNRAEYLPERRAMLQAWADWLDAASNVDAGGAQG